MGAVHLVQDFSNNHLEKYRNIHSSVDILMYNPLSFNQRSQVIFSVNIHVHIDTSKHENV